MSDLNIYAARISDGDTAAFEAVFMAYFPKLKLFIDRIVKDEFVAEELAQDVFLKIWEGREGLSAVQSLSTYLYQMAKNAAFNHLKHRLVTDRYAEQLRTTVEPSYESIEDELYARETAAIVARVVAKFPPQRRRIFEMSRHQGLKNNEIAAALGITPKTVENHLTLALGELRKILKWMMIVILFHP